MNKMEIAKAASLLSNAKHSRRIGAALFAGSRLLSIGYNTFGTTHPKSAPLCNIHAEQRALIRRQYYENGNRLIMYVYRETTDGKPGCSHPCKNCLGLLKEAGVSTVHFLDKAGKLSELKL
jgi:deoxycytidylate deaminase